ncbi:hypothetical protein GTV32_14110 [Gordonia sp. SID5947]|uniref:DUF2231 domain-containing protein n=1 Tax=Gordonia sp. SID5947 TaxID=2690315 RepID=UPI0013711A73|nr:DUF2231 domain-containing protein [Gordonia sp. SID5947]MYR07373.1 hypothetical protein [Gordonia sp. SID5947]
MDTINGLPLHPLIVHGVVVFVPLTSLLAIVGVLWPAAQRRLGVVTPVVALATLIAVPLATSAGEALEQHVPHTSAVERHTQLGEQMIYWAGAVFALTAVWWILHEPRTMGYLTRWWQPSSSAQRAMNVVVGFVLVCVAVGAAVMVYRIGESGSRAVWG